MATYWVQGPWSILSPLRRPRFARRRNLQEEEEMERDRRGALSREVEGGCIFLVEGGDETERRRR